MIKYSVHIQGIRPPFAWQLVRIKGATRTFVGQAQEADSRDEAIIEARTLAFDLESDRIQADTREEVELFEVSGDGTLTSLLDSLEAVPEDWT